MVTRAGSRRPHQVIVSVENKSCIKSKNTVCPNEEKHSSPLKQIDTGKLQIDKPTNKRISLKVPVGKRTRLDRLAKPYMSSHTEELYRFEPEIDNSLPSFARLRSRNACVKSENIAPHKTTSLKGISRITKAAGPNRACSSLRSLNNIQHAGKQSTHKHVQGKTSTPLNAAAFQKDNASGFPQWINCIQNLASPLACNISPVPMMLSPESVLSEVHVSANLSYSHELNSPEAPLGNCQKQSILGFNEPTKWNCEGKTLSRKRYKRTSVKAVEDDEDEGFTEVDSDILVKKSFISFSEHDERPYLPDVYNGTSPARSQETSEKQRSKNNQVNVNRQGMLKQSEDAVGTLSNVVCPINEMSCGPDSGVMVDTPDSSQQKSVDAEECCPTDEPLFGELERKPCGRRRVLKANTTRSGKGNSKELSATSAKKHVTSFDNVQRSELNSGSKKTKRSPSALPAWTEQFSELADIATNYELIIE